MNKWPRSFLVGTIWFFWHYSSLPDPIYMLTGQRLPFLIGAPICILLLSLLSAMFSDLVVKTRSVLLPTVGHAVTKFGSPLSMAVVFAALILLQVVWDRLKIAQVPLHPEAA